MEIDLGGIAKGYTSASVIRIFEAHNVKGLVNLGGNVLLFIPAGVLLPKLWPKQRNFFRFFATCTGIMFFIEVLQLFTLLGSFDIDDLILNLAGMTLGFIGYHLFRKQK